MKIISRLPIPLIFSLVIIACASLNWSVQSTAQDEGQSSAASASEPAAQKSESKKNSGAAKFFTAPFRFLGRLFGSHRKTAQAQRRSAEDELPQSDPKELAFESAAIARVSSAVAQASSERSVAETLQKSAREQLEHGRELISQGRHREATTLLAHAASLDPSLTEARVLLATAFDLQGMRERAAYHYQDVIQQRQQASDKETALALNNRGYSLYLAGAHKEALKLIAHAVELDSSNARFLNNLGLVNFRLNKHKEAVKAFAQAGGEVRGYVNLAILLEQDGRRRDALKYFERARQLDPSSELVRQRLQDFDERANRDNAQLAATSSGRPRPVQPTSETVKQ